MLKTVTVSFAVVLSCCVCVALGKVDISSVRSVSCQQCDDKNPCPKDYDCNDASGRCQLSECSRAEDCGVGKECLPIPCCEVENQPMAAMTKICRDKDVPLCDVMCLVPDPVCGSDGVTYDCGATDAHCHATCVKHEGECRVNDEFHNRVCKKCKREVKSARGNNYVCEKLKGLTNVWTHRECQRDADCDGDDVCEKKGCCEGPMAGYWGARDPNSICVPKEQATEFCIDIYQPVCSYAGNQFSNYCVAEVAGECVEYEGLCEDD